MQVLVQIEKTQTTKYFCDVTIDDSTLKNWVIKNYGEPDTFDETEIMYDDDGNSYFMTKKIPKNWYENYADLFILDQNANTLSISQQYETDPENISENLDVVGFEGDL